MIIIQVILMLTRAILKEFKSKLACVETQIMAHIMIQFACIYDKLTCVDC